MRNKKTGRIPFPHLGETIREDYLKPLGMSVNKLALELRVPATRMTEIVHGGAALPPTPRCAWRVISTPRPTSGWTSRRHPIWPRPPKAVSERSSAASAPARPRD